ncbi:MAG: DNA polymerase I, partial [Bacillota bacterium]|nr:DNA polymerase I [Bacillota bacterium]
MSIPKILIVDGNSILNRAFYGLQGSRMLSTADGLYTNAIFGFINILNKYMEEEKPEYICVAFDLKAPTFRHKEFEGYKAKRKGMPPELAMQVPVIKDVLDAMNIKRLEFEGYEADDIIGHLSLCAEQNGLNAIIVTGDRDSLQLASEKTKIKLPVTKGGKTETEEYDNNGVFERYGVTPLQFIDVKGLMGDTSDNIPGVPGIGEKTALELIKSYGSIENIYENLEKIEKKSIKDKLENGRELAFMSKRLATIDRTTLNICPMEELKLKAYDTEKMYELFKRLEFKSFIEKYCLRQEVSKPLTNMAKVKEIRIIEDQNELDKFAGFLEDCESFSILYMLDKNEGNTAQLSAAAISVNDSEAWFIRTGKGIEENGLISSFKKVFEDPSVKKSGHNMKDFLVYLKRKGIELKGLAFDTMIAAYLMDPSRSTYTISELAQLYLNTDIEAIENLTGKGRNYTAYRDIPIERLSVVSAEHSGSILMLSAALDQLITKNDQIRLYYEVELPLVEVLADMEYQGFKVNTQELKNLSVELEYKIEKLAERIYYLAGESFNINSTKQLGVILFEKLGLPSGKKTKTGYSTDADTLEKLASKHEMVGEILEYRQLVKLKSTYAEGLLNVINPATGKIHSSFNQTVTATGRISSTEPNLQNIPVRLEIGR